MPPSFTGAVRDSLSNLAASLAAGNDKAANDSFVLFDLDRGQIEAMAGAIGWPARSSTSCPPTRCGNGAPGRAIAPTSTGSPRPSAGSGCAEAVQRALVSGTALGSHDPRDGAVSRRALQAPTLALGSGCGRAASQSKR